MRLLVAFCLALGPVAVSVSGPIARAQPPGGSQGRTEAPPGQRQNWLGPGPGHPRGTLFPTHPSGGLGLPAPAPLSGSLTLPGILIPSGMLHPGQGRPQIRTPHVLGAELGVARPVQNLPTHGREGPEGEAGAADPDLGPLPKLDLPEGPGDPGPEGGLTLDAAIGLLLERNLGLQALRVEIPKARADVLTAGLRDNPLISVDGLLLPYHDWSPDRPGGPPEYNLNFALPVDLSGKRRARIAVARRAERVIEAQFQDAVRNQVDRLHDAYVDVLGARETLRYAEAYLGGISRIADPYTRGMVPGPPDPDARGVTVRAMDDQIEQARYQVQMAGLTLDRAHRSLARMLDLPAGQLQTLGVRGRLREIHPLPAPPEALVEMALAHRPDLAAFRLGIDRAEGEVDLARAARFSDIFLVWRPIGVQDFGPAQGLSPAYSYGLGMTTALPVFNRNQGHIARAEWNAHQTRLGLAALEHRVAGEVEEIVHAFRVSRAGVLRLEREVLPAARKARDDMYRAFRRDETKVNDHLGKQQDYNDVVADYRDALIRHRRIALRLNTAVGVRLLP